MDRAPVFSAIKMLRGGQPFNQDDVGAIERRADFRFGDAGEGDLDVVYVDVRDLALERQTLTDGSTVLNVVVRENK